MHHRLQLVRKIFSPGRQNILGIIIVFTLVILSSATFLIVVPCGTYCQYVWYEKIINYFLSALLHSIFFIPELFLDNLSVFIYTFVGFLYIYIFVSLAAYFINLKKTFHLISLLFFVFGAGITSLYLNDLRYPSDFRTLTPLVEVRAPEYITIIDDLVDRWPSTTVGNAIVVKHSYFCSKEINCKKDALMDNQIYVSTKKSPLKLNISYAGVFVESIFRSYENEKKVRTVILDQNKKVLIESSKKNIPFVVSYKGEPNQIYYVQISWFWPQKFIKRFSIHWVTDEELERLKVEN